MKMFNQAKQIVEGHLNEITGNNQSLSEKRLEICKRCPLYKDAFGGQCNPRYWLNPETGDVSTYRRGDNYYKGCGCRLQAKTRVVKAKCPAKKW